MPVIDAKATGDNIVKMRKDRGISVRDIQGKMGFATPMAVYKWQQGIAMPSLDNLVILADLFQVKIDDILVTRMV